MMIAEHLLSLPLELVLPEGVGHAVQLHRVIHPLPVIPALMPTLGRAAPGTGEMTARALLILASH